MIYSAAQIRQLIERPAKDARLTVGPLDGVEFYLTGYSDGKIDLLVSVTSDPIRGDFIERTLTVWTSSRDRLRHERVHPILLLRLDASGRPIALMERTPLVEAELIREILRPLTELATR